MAVGSKGLASVAQRAEEVAASRVGFGLRRYTKEFRWDGNKPPAENSISLRLLGDDIIVTTQMHRGVPLPENKFFFGVCRHAFPIASNFCYVCDVVGKEFDGDAKAKKRNGYTPTDVAIALAVEMEAAEKRGGISWTPKMVEFEIPQTTDDEKSGKATEETKEYRKILDKLGQPGTKVMVPNIGLMVGTISGSQALFDYATRRTSISDRVFDISRHGNKLDTKWNWDHEGKDEEPDPTKLLADFSAKYPFELPEEWAMRNGSEERYDFFFKLGAPAGSGEQTSSEPDDVEPVSDSRAALMARLRGQSS